MATTLRDVPVHDGSKFFWHQGVGSCDASDLGRVSARLYADSTDVGFIVRSHRTGRTKAFTLARVTKDSDEVLSWAYEAADGTKIVVYND